jgi:hypothetical protein
VTKTHFKWNNRSLNRTESIRAIGFITRTDLQSFLPLEDSRHCIIVNKSSCAAAGGLYFQNEALSGTTQLSPYEATIS